MYKLRHDIEAYQYDENITSMPSWLLEKIQNGKVTFYKNKTFHVAGSIGDVEKGNWLVKFPWGDLEIFDDKNFNKWFKT